MPSLTHSAESLFSSLEHLIAGLAESVIATAKHLFMAVAAILKGTLNLSETVIQDAWKVVEGVLRLFFNNLIAIVLLSLGVACGVAHARYRSSSKPAIAQQSNGKGPRSQSAKAAKGKKKTA